MMLQRLRLEYRTREELGDDLEGKECGHCGSYVRHPLLRLPLPCPATAYFRPLSVPAAYSAGGGVTGKVEAPAKLRCRIDMPPIS